MFLVVSVSVAVSLSHPAATPPIRVLLAWIALQPQLSAMAEVEPQSIKSRIAALNLEKVHAPNPGARPSYSYDAVAPAKKKPPPPPPPANRPLQLRAQTANNPPLLDSGTASTHRTGNQPDVERPPARISPALPPRPPHRATSQQSPALPPRKSSERSVTRRESSESISTIASGISTLSLGSTKTNGSNGSTLYQVRAPAYDPSKLPPLPPKKQEEQKSATRAAMTSKRHVVPTRELPPQIKPSPPCECPGSLLDIRLYGHGYGDQSNMSASKLDYDY